MEEEQEYDVVIDVLQKHMQKLSDMDRGDIMLTGIMTQIRFKQIHELNTAINVWKKYKLLSDEQYTAGYSDGPVSDGGMDPRG